MDLATAPPARAAAPELRLLHSQEEYAACVQLQKDTWGQHFNEVVPATILKITNRVGGIVAGAFHEGRLVAFVYGITGLDRERLAHWSHMLAVRPEFRDLGIGRRLKEFQRDLLARRGVETILWSYDPLVARNAHLNLNRLGAHVDEYVVDMYPATSSDLHAFGTDRFIVSWGIAAPGDPGDVGDALSSRDAGVGTASAARSHGPSGRAAPDSAPLFGPAAVYNSGCESGNQNDGRDRRADGDAPLARGDEPVDFVPPRVRVEVPADIETIATRSPAGALAWRTSTRRAFNAWLGRGYAVSGFRREADGACYYTLTAPVPPDAAAPSGGRARPAPRPEPSSPDLNPRSPSKEP